MDCPWLFLVFILLLVFFRFILVSHELWFLQSLVEQDRVIEVLVVILVIHIFYVLINFVFEILKVVLLRIVILLLLIRFIGGVRVLPLLLDQFEGWDFLALRWSSLVSRFNRELLRRT